MLDDESDPCLTLEPFDEKAEVTAVCFLRDGKLAVETRRDGAFIWNLATNKLLFQLKPPDQRCQSLVIAFAQLQDGRLACGNNLGDIHIIDLEANKLLQTIECANDEVLWLKVLPNGHLAACCAEISIWDIDNKNEETTLIAQFGPDLIDIYADYQTWKHEDRFPECNHLSKLCDLDMKNWDAWPENGEGPTMTLQYHFEVLSNGHVALCYLKPDCAVVNVWNPETSENIKTITLYGDAIESCTIMPSGDAVVCHTNNKVDIYSLEDEKMFQSFRNEKGPILAINQHSRHSLQLLHCSRERRLFETVFDCCSNDGRYIAIGYRQSILNIFLFQS